MFDIKEYRKQYYLKNKDQLLKKSKIRYEQNKKEVLEKRKKKIQDESAELRRKRLDFHKKYNKKNSRTQKERQQTDKYKFNQYKHSAKRRSLIFDIKYIEFIDIFHGKCGYCGEKDCRGIDRVDNLKGYTTRNITPCCEMCNKMKWKWNKTDFLNHIIKISHNHDRTKHYRSIRASGR